MCIRDSNRATSRLKRLPSTAASRDKTDRKFDRKFDCKTDAGVRDALAQTAQTAPASSGFIIPPPRQGYTQRPLSVAALRHIEWLMASQTPRELVWRVLEYWNPIEYRNDDADIRALKVGIEELKQQLIAEDSPDEDEEVPL